MVGSAASAAIASVAGCGNSGSPGGPDAQPHVDAPVADAPRGVVWHDDPVDPMVVPESLAFPLGVAAGEVDAASALLWTRYMGGHSLRASVFEVVDGIAVREQRIEGVAAQDSAVHLRAHGLTASTSYRYVVWEDDPNGLRRSALGSFRTAPASDALPTLRLGVTSCAKHGYDFAPLARAAAQDLDVFCFIGDIVYADDAHDGPTFDAKYAETFGEASHRALRSAHAMLLTWDDHEVGNNWNRDTISDEQLAHGSAAYFRHLPLTSHATSPIGIWRVQRFGRTADVFILDCRSERRPSQDQYISRAQMDWLKAELAASTAVFKVILNTVPIANMPSLWDINPKERWEGYPSQRDEILRHIEAGAITGVVWLSGDFHLGAMAHVAKDGLGSAQREIIAGPAAQLPNPLVYTLTGAQFPFATAANNFVAVTLDPQARSVAAAWIDGAGQTLYETTWTV